MTILLSILVVSFSILCLPTVFTTEDDLGLQQDFRRHPVPVYEEFPIYWNVPSFMCLKHGINFSDATQRFGIKANRGDQFRGEHVNILYDPGNFPAMLKSSCGRTVKRNGGIPQNGNITQHLAAMEKVIDQLMAKDFSGAAVIDFEAYRPNFRQNYNEQEIYTNMSKNAVRQAHPSWDERAIQQKAKNEFERATRVFMEGTLKLGKLLRPRALWGYYGFPYCYNYRMSSGMNPSCSVEVQKENNEIQWLYDHSDSLYPSIYMGIQPKVNARKFVQGRMKEAVRVAARAYPGKVPLVSPYMWYKYFDSLDFVTPGDFYEAMEATRQFKAGGYVLWGSSNDFQTKEKCQAVYSYLIKVIGPTIQRIRRNAKREKHMHDEHIDFVPYHNETVHLTQQEEESPNYYYVEASKPDGNFSDSPPYSGEESNNYPVEDSRQTTYQAEDSKQTNYQVEDSKQTNYQVEDSKQANYSAVPVVIYTAFSPNGSRTIYQYDNNYEYSVVKTEQPSTEKPKSLETRGVSSKPRKNKYKKYSSTPWLVEYMKGFDNVLNRIAKRWSQRS